MKLTSFILLSLIPAFLSTHQCGPGGVLCPSNTCHYPSYIEGCFIYATSHACHECQFNYIKNGSFCEYSPSSNSGNCCQKFKSTGECGKCANGLALLNGDCQEVKIPGCLEKSYSGDCRNCAIDYTLLGGRCIKKIEGCSGYKATGDCQYCQDGYKLLKGLCIPTGISEECCHKPFTISSQGICYIQGCKTIFDYGCAECEDGYSLLPDGSCFNGGIKGCAIYDQNGKCSRCLEPFYEDFGGYCKPYGCLESRSDGICLKCDENKGFQTELGYCLLKNCLINNQDQCLLCKEGFVEGVNGCEEEKPKEVCTVCKKNEYLGQDGYCYPKEPGCIEYSYGKCQKCQQGLYLDIQYNCQEKKPGCVYKGRICSSCLAPFTFYNNKCLIQGCTKFSNYGCQQCYEPYILGKNHICTFRHCLGVFNTRCKKCEDGYRIGKDGQCHAQDPYCNSYSFQDICLKCVKGYYLDENNLCRQQKYGCNYVDGNCVSCRAPFEFNSQKQSCQIDGCVKYFIGGCQECRNEYQLRYNSCKLPHCLISFEGYCRQCDPNYILRTDGVCKNKDQYCYKYDDFGFCIQCAPKYYLSVKHNKCKLKEPGCQYDQNDRCASCDKPFIYDGIRCDIIGCLELGYGGCEKCFYPRQLTEGGECWIQNCLQMEDGACITCKQHYYLNNNGYCENKDPNCLIYGSNCCQKCKKGYRIDEKGICEYADEHCWDFSMQGHCYNCDRLYFLNPFHRCQLKQSSCLAYSAGRCIDCKNLYYLHRGKCYPNSKGCLKQKTIKKCLTCEEGYKLSYGKCLAEITRLSWNSIDMNFWDGQSDEEVQESQQVFTVGKKSKINLESAIGSGYAKVIYSSCIKGRTEFQVDGGSEHGWEPDNQSPQGQYVGIESNSLQTFYAVDIKILRGNSLKKFVIEYSENGEDFYKVGKFELQNKYFGIVKTFYFKPVYAKFMRIIVIKGNPKIKFQFYFSQNLTNEQIQYQADTYIQEAVNGVVSDSLHGEVFKPTDGCIDKELCWMGLELCQPKEIYGFSLSHNSTNIGQINSVYLEYSVDGVKFDCYNECEEVQLGDGQYELDPTIVGSKFRIHPVRWQGEPVYSVSFRY